eukprot:898303-Pleurochrysis_carterae.AAC.1
MPTWAQLKSVTPGSYRVCYWLRSKSGCTNFVQRLAQLELGWLPIPSLKAKATFQKPRQLFACSPNTTRTYSSDRSGRRRVDQIMTAYTATGYRAVRLGVFIGTPIWTTHALCGSLARKRAQARGLGAPTERLSKRAAHWQRQPLRAGVSKSLASGAGVLREYTCDASPTRKTEHVSVRLR